MVQAMININEHTNRVLNIVKAKYGFTDKSKTIEWVVKEYEESFLEPQVRPEFLKKLEKIRKGKYHKFNSVEELKGFIEKNVHHSNK